MPTTTSLIASSSIYSSSSSFLFMLLNFILLELSLLKRKTQPPIMDHSYMQNRRATSVFSIKPAAASWKVFKDEQEEDEEEEDTAEEDEEEEVEETSSRAKKKRLMHLVGGAGGGSMTTMGKKVSTPTTTVGRNPLPAAAGGCQVEKCVADLSDSKRYHQRHKVCEYHSKAQVVIVAGLTQRFCQQCSRFHELSEFDDAKRSCRRRLAGHNERRRKQFSEPRGEVSATAGHRTSASGSGSQLDKKQCRQADERGRNQIAV